MEPKLKQKYNDSGDSNKTKFLCTFSNYANNSLTRVALINLSYEIWNIKLPKWVDDDTFICPLPNDEVFCYGNQWWERNGGLYNMMPSPKISGFAFIIKSDLSTKILNEGTPCYKSGGVFYNGKVFLFGGHVKANTEELADIASEYDLQKDRWRAISRLPIPSSGCSCVEYMGFILIGGFSNSHNVFAYDIAEDSYSEFLTDLQEIKIICKHDGYAYLINPGGNIYESEYSNPFVWNLINKCAGKKEYDFISSQASFENYFYFVENHFGFPDFYRFDLVRKEMSDGNLDKLIHR